ncbi:hypothetical protein D3C73_1610650 [compost metagenome]
MRPGFFFASATRSPTVFQGRFGFTTRRKGRLPPRAIGVKSLTGSYGTFFISHGAAECEVLVVTNSV